MDHATSFNEPNADMVDNIATGHGQVTQQFTSREKSSEEERKVKDSEETFPKFDDMPFWQVGVILARCVIFSQGCACRKLIWRAFLAWDWLYLCSR